MSSLPTRAQQFPIHEKDGRSKRPHNFGIINFGGLLHWEWLVSVAQNSYSKNTSKLFFQNHKDVLDKCREQYTNRFFHQSEKFRCL